jgi:hypothetical protein
MAQKSKVICYCSAAGTYLERYLAKTVLNIKEREERRERGMRRE